MMTITIIKIPLIYKLIYYILTANNLELTKEHFEMFFPALHLNSPTNWKEIFISIKLCHKQMYNTL